MHKSLWKWAFFILLSLNFLLMVMLFVLTQQKDMSPTEKVVRQSQQRQDFEITLTSNALEGVVQRKIAEAGGDIHFTIAKDFYFRLPVSMGVIESELVVQTTPRVGEDGLLHLSIRALRLGGLNLPEARTLALVQQILSVEGIAIDANGREIILDPSAFLNTGNMRIWAKTVDMTKDRFVFQGNLGD